MDQNTKCPFPWFGGKSRVAKFVWQRFGDVPNYVEPFFGSGAVLFNRPTPGGARVETVNDKDGFVANFWRAIQHDSGAVAHYANWPANENDMHARHAYLKPRRAELSRRLEGDPEYYDAKIAGWWCWGICLWIGGGWCSDSIRGPWVVEDGMLIKRKQVNGVWRSMPHLSSEGNCMVRTVSNGVSRKRMSVGGNNGRGIHAKGIKRQIPNVGNGGKGVARKRISLDRPGRGLGHCDNLTEWFAALHDRLATVRVCCGDWSRICGPSPTTNVGLTGVFLDPPYSTAANRDDRIYAEDCSEVALQVRDWAIENGDNPKIRIALCGYEGEYTMPDYWESFAWRAGNSYGNAKNGNNRRERIWFSPHCLKPENQLNLFDV